MNNWERYEQGCQSLLELVWRRIAPETYLKALVVMVNGLEKLGRCKTGQDKKSFFSELNDYWQVDVQSQQLSFFMRSRRGQVIVE